MTDRGGKQQRMDFGPPEPVIHYGGPDPQDPNWRERNAAIRAVGAHSTHAERKAAADAFDRRMSMSAGRPGPAERK